MARIDEDGGIDGDSDSDGEATPAHGPSDGEATPAHLRPSDGEETAAIAAAMAAAVGVPVDEDLADDTLYELADLTCTEPSARVPLVPFVLDSVSGMHLARSIAARFNITFGFQHLRVCSTLGELRDHILAQKRAETGSGPTRQISELAPLMGLRGLLIFKMVVANVADTIGPIALKNTVMWDRNGARAGLDPGTCTPVGCPSPLHSGGP